MALGLVVGCGGDDDSDKQPAKSTKPAGGGAQAPDVTMKDIAFTPMELSVKKGTTVTWTNDEDVGHDVHQSGGPGPDFSSGDEGGLKKGDTFKHRFTKPGTYDYVCRVHSNMSAYVIVK